MLEPNFEKADSRNLTRVSLDTLCEFFHNDDRFSAPEVKAAKSFKSGRENYGDEAIGYVCVRRYEQKCIVKVRVCLETSTRNKPYSVYVTINEEDEEVIDVKCLDCLASEGGCKHDVALLMWIHRRSSEPASTEVRNYWIKPALSAAGTSMKYKTAKEIAGCDTTVDVGEEKCLNFFNKVLEIAKDKQLDSQLSRYCCQLKEREVVQLSLQQLLLDFCESQKSSADEFIVFASSQISSELCALSESKTRNQSHDVLWFELRYGRVTASKLYEAAHCKTSDGSFVRSVIGAVKVFDTQEMQRRRLLEKKVLDIAAKELDTTFFKAGFVIKVEYPVLGASPDGLGHDYVVKVKCPSTEKGFNNFLPHGNISMKCKAQINLQMLATGMSKGLFIVASPDFEESHKIIMKWIDYDEDFTMSLIDQAMSFWKIYIFPNYYFYSSP